MMYSGQVKLFDKMKKITDYTTLIANKRNKI